MPFEKKLQNDIISYTERDLPADSWYVENFYPFIGDVTLRTRLITEFKNARIIYKIFEGLQAKDELLLAQVKTQVIMYVSIQEAVINYVLFEKKSLEPEVQSLLIQERNIPISIPQHKEIKLKTELLHNGKDIYVFYKDLKPVDKTKIRYEQKVNACFNLGLISEGLKNDLIKLYEYRNTVHIEAEIKKGFTYDLEMSLMAYRRVEGLSIELSRTIQT